MSVEKQLREMIREEVERLISPLTHAVEELRGQGGVLAQLGSLLGGKKRGPGRPPNPFKRALALTGGRRTRRSRAENGANDRACAIIGCKRPARSKGYCAAHYQKFRNLSKTGRLPSAWKAFAEPSSVDDLVLPRGRAGAKALAASRKRK